MSGTTLWQHGTEVAARSEDIECGDRVFNRAVGFGTVVRELEHGFIVRPARPKAYENHYVNPDRLEKVSKQEYPEYTG